MVHLRRFPAIELLAGAALVLLAASCAERRPDAEPPVRGPAAGAALDQVPELRAMLELARESPPTPAPGGYLTRSLPREPHATHRRLGVRVEPAEARLTITSDRDGVPLVARRLSQGPSAARVEGGALHLEDSSGAVDAVVMARARGVEDLLVVHDPSAPLGYELELPAGFRLGHPAASVVELLDATGAPRLRVVAGAAWDATGKRLPVALHVEDGDRIRVEVAAEGARPPLLVDPEFIDTGAPAFERSVEHTLTITLDGRVLVVGGTTDDAPVELFDARTNRFLVVGPERPARLRHSASLLRDGRVLVAGGRNADARGRHQALGTAEIIDPKTGDTEDGALLQARALHTSTRLGDGRVLLVGGERYEADGTPVPLATTELWDPTTSSSAAGPSLSEPRSEHTATLLPDGRVLVAGGHAASGTPSVSSTAEIFDPDSGAFTVVPDTMTTARTRHAATALHDGRVLLWGGAASLTTDVIGDFFDPSSETFTATSWLTSGVSRPASLALPSGHVYAGGVGVTSVDGAFDPALPDGPPEGVPEQAAAQLPHGRIFTLGASTGHLREELPVMNERSYGFSPRGYHAATLLTSGRVLFTGGRHAVLAGVHETLPQSVVEELDPVTESVAAVGPMARDRYLHTATRLPDGRVLVVGGESPSGADNRIAELYDPTSKTFSDTDRMDVDRARHTATSLPNGDVLVVGGSLDKMAERYALSLDAFVPAGVLETARSGHTATRLPDGRVLVAGGDTALLELFDPATNTFSTAGTMLVARTGHGATLLGDGTVLLLGGLTQPGPPAEVWDPTTGISQERLAELGNSALNVHSAVTLPSGNVYVAGRNFGSVYRPALDQLSPAPPGRAGGSLTRLLDGSVITAGSYNGAPNPWQGSVERLQLPPHVGAPEPSITGYPALVSAGGSAEIVGSHIAGIIEASSGSAAACASDQPLAIWMPADEGTPAIGELADFTEGSATWRVPVTSFPGLGSLFVVTNGAPGGAVVVTIAGAAVGVPCTGGHTCASGVCADGVCCDVPCGGCSACTAARKGGGTDGTCGPVPPGELPGGEATCPAQALSECGRTGTCDGKGACAVAPEGAPCLEGAACVAGVCTVSPAFCDGAHQIVTGDVVVVDCAPYRCNHEPACLEACSSSLDCAPGLTCTARRTCEAPGAPPTRQGGCRVGSGWDGAPWLAFTVLSLLVARSRRGRGRAALLAVGALALGCRRIPVEPSPEGGAGGGGGSAASPGAGGAGGADLEPAICGDGARQSSEECDGDDLGGATCVGLGLSSGTPHCRHDCTLDATSCVGCGNGYVDPGEECDGAAVGDQTCLSNAPLEWIGHLSDLGIAPDLTDLLVRGSAACTADCTLDLGACGYCYDGVITGPEVCDDYDAAGPALPALGGATCSSVDAHYVAGTLACDICAYLDVAQCLRPPPAPCVAGQNCSVVLHDAGSPTLPPDPALALGDDALTVEAWLWVDDLDAGPCTIGPSRGWNVFSTDFDWALVTGPFADSVSLLAGPVADGMGSKISAYDALTEGVWTHVAGVFDPQAGEMRLYVQGALTASGPLAPKPLSSPGNIVLAGDLQCSLYYTPQLAGVARIDEVRISGVARYVADFTPDAVFTPDADTLALYHLDEGGGDVLLDASGNGRHGDFYLGVWGGEHP